MVGVFKKERPLVLAALEGSRAMLVVDVEREELLDKLLLAAMVGCLLLELETMRLSCSSIATTAPGMDKESIKGKPREVGNQSFISEMREK
jgi:hypothetical protein